MRKLIGLFAAFVLFSIPALAQKGHPEVGGGHIPSHGPKAYRAPAHPTPPVQGHSERAGHRAPGDVTLVLSGLHAGAHMLERQLSRLDAQHLLEPASDYLIAPQTVGPFGSGVQVFVDERAICRRAEQREPVGRIVEVGLQACLACGELERPFLDPLLK